MFNQATFREILLLLLGLMMGEVKYHISFTESDFCYVYTIMEATVSCLLMLQKYINSKQISQK